MPWSKESRQSRGYDAAWEKVRQVVIARAKGLCEQCMKDGKVVAGRDVDHVVSKAKAATLRWSRARTDHPSNLQYLCSPCHAKKSAEDEGRTYRAPRPAIGLDGWPVENG